MAVSSAPVLVVGGGIAGLATARALRQRDVEALVVERAPAHDRGAGVYLPANAVHAIGELGLATRLAERAHRITSQLFLDQRGRTLMEVDLSDVWASTGWCVALSHADLHELLAADVPVRYGTTVTALDDQGSSVAATLDDGSTEAYDLVVGADGVRSWARSAAFAGDRARFLGQVSWRWVVDDAVESSAWTVWLGRGATFLAVPLGGGRTYCFAAVARHMPSNPVEDEPLGPARLFEQFAEPVLTLLAGRSGDGTSRRSRRSSNGRGPANKSSSSGTRPTPCRPTWPREWAWLSRTPSSWPRRSQEAGHWPSWRRDAGRGSSSSRPKRIGATAHATCPRSSATRCFDGVASSSFAATTSP